MPSVEHVEKHFTATAAVRDIVIGMADGLTVPFASGRWINGSDRVHGHRGDRGIRGNCGRLDCDGTGRISCGADGYGALRVGTRSRVSGDGGATGN